MKKQFFHIVAALALICGVFAFTGCTDFEKDINDLTDRIEALETGKIADLENQVKTLQEALNSAQGAIDAIEALGIDGLKDQLDALQGVIDGINLDDYATKDYVDGTFATKDAVKKLEEALGALEGRVEALEGMLSEENIKAILDQIKGAQEDATKALGLIKSLQEALGVYAEAGKLQAALDSKLDIEDFEAKFEEALKAALANDGEVSSYIAKAIQDAVDKVKVLFSQRLTSVSLIPELYVDGIPAIALTSFKYYPIITIQEEMVGGEPNGDLVHSDESVTTAQSATVVRYHVSPAGITDEDFDLPSYVIETAKSITKATVEDELLEVTEAKMNENEELEVTVKKLSGVNLSATANPDGSETIYTAALCVPIAEKNLVEGETEANVYSEYSRLYETTVEPKIAALIDISKNNQKDYNCTVDNHSHFYTFDEIYAANSPVSNAQVYNQSLDLLDMVTGCYTTTDGKAVKKLTKAELEAAGLTFVFGIPTIAYNPEGVTTGTDQQQFAKIEEDGHTLIATLPDGETDNRAAIDKTPIVRVSLMDGENTVDVRYFKIQWTDIVLDPEEIEVDPFTYVLSCDNFDAEFTWKDMVLQVLSKIGDNGISHDQFIKNYDVNNATWESGDKGKVTGNFNFTWDEDAPESAAAIEWTITPAEIGTLDNVDGKSVTELEEGDVVKTYTVIVTFPGATDYIGDLTVKFSVNVELPVLPKIHGFVEPNWTKMGELARIRPVQYDSQFPLGTTVEYDFNLRELFNPTAGLPVDNIVTDDEELISAWQCRKWDIQFSKSQTMKGYQPGFGTKAEYSEGNTGYILSNGGVRASEITPNAANWFNTDVTKIALSLENNKEGIALLNDVREKTPAYEDYKAGKLNTVTINVWGSINEYNAVKVHTFDVWFVRPLIVNAELEDEFYDGVIDGDRIDAAKAFGDNVKDHWDYTVAVYKLADAELTTDELKLAEKLRQYYGLGDTPIWKVNDALISLVDDGNGNIVPDNTLDINNEADRKKMKSVNNIIDQKYSLTVSDDQRYLIFKNRMGISIESPVNLYVPCEISHKYGTETFWVKILVNPGSTTGNTIR